MKMSSIVSLFTVALLFGVTLLTPLLAVAASPCGGPGQRACCVTERVPSCNSGMHEVLGCTGDCTCGGANPLGAFNSVGHCEPNFVPDPCGGPGQRACCVTERIPSCNNGLHEVLGCSTGNCICGGPNPGNTLKSIGHCEANPTITPCGGPGQRACCVTERVPSCNNGTHEELGCSGGNCICGGPNPGFTLKSLGHCVANPTITPCGGKDQRACCVTERVPSCNQGLHEELGCTGPNCICGGPNPGFTLKSIGHCVANPVATPCGGPGQRACCVTEKVPSCNPGAHEVLGCSGMDCTCGGPNPGGVLKSIGHCEANTCGGIGQRACCITERVPSCDFGAHEELGCSGDCRCGGANPLGALNSVGHCVANPAPPAATPCGGQGQRACCVTERVPSCNPGLVEVLGCTGPSCKCGGANPLGALNSIGHCELPCETAKAQLEVELAKTNAELKSLKQRFGQPVGPGATAPPATGQPQYPPPQIKQPLQQVPVQPPGPQPPAPQPKQLQQPLIKQSPRQLLR